MACVWLATYGKRTGFNWRFVPLWIFEKLSRGGFLRLGGAFLTMFVDIGMQLPILKPVRTVFALGSCCGQARKMEFRGRVAMGLISGPRGPRLKTHLGEFEMGTGERRKWPSAFQPIL